MPSPDCQQKCQTTQECIPLRSMRTTKQVNAPSNHHKEQVVQPSGSLLQEKKAAELQHQVEQLKSQLPHDCASVSKLFRYTVRGCERPDLSGSIPRQIFQAEPDSALNRMNNGEWGTQWMSRDGLL